MPQTSQGQDAPVTSKSSRRNTRTHNGRIPRNMEHMEHKVCLHRSPSRPAPFTHLSFYYGPDGSLNQKRTRETEIRNTRRTRTVLDMKRLQVPRKAPKSSLAKTMALSRAWSGARPSPAAHISPIPGLQISLTLNSSILGCPHRQKRLLGFAQRYATSQVRIGALAPVPPFPASDLHP